MGLGQCRPCRSTRSGPLSPPRPLLVRTADTLVSMRLDIICRVVAVGCEVAGGRRRLEAVFDGWSAW